MSLVVANARLQAKAEPPLGGGAPLPEAQRAAAAAVAAAATRRKGRRSSLFDVGSTARSITTLDLQAAVAAGHSDLSAATADTKRRLAPFTLGDLACLRTLRPDDVSEGTTLVRLSLGEYVDTMSRHRRLVSDEIASYLTERIPLFSSWQSTRIVSVSRAFELRRYPDGHVVYRQGDVADAICLVREGSLELYRLVGSELSHLFPTGPREWRVESRKRPVLVHVARTSPHSWVGYEALGWVTLLQVRALVRVSRRATHLVSLLLVPRLQQLEASARTIALSKMLSPQLSTTARPATNDAAAGKTLSPRLAQLKKAAQTVAASQKGYAATLLQRAVQLRDPVFVESLLDNAIHGGEAFAVNRASEMTSRLQESRQRRRNAETEDATRQRDMLTGATTHATATKPQSASSARGTLSGNASGIIGAAAENSDTDPSGVDRGVERAHVHRVSPWASELPADGGGKHRRQRKPPGALARAHSRVGLLPLPPTSAEGGATGSSGAPRRSGSREASSRSGRAAEARPASRSGEALRPQSRCREAARQDRKEGKDPTASSRPGALQDRPSESRDSSAPRTSSRRGEYSSSANASTGTPADHGSPSPSPTARKDAAEENPPEDSDQLSVSPSHARPRLALAEDAAPAAVPAPPSLAASGQVLGSAARVAAALASHLGRAPDDVADIKPPVRQTSAVANGETVVLYLR